jgi:membrane protein YqaA with SNARE-associated domain
MYVLVTALAYVMLFAVRTSASSNFLLGAEPAFAGAIAIQIISTQAVLTCCCGCGSCCSYAVGRIGCLTLSGWLPTVIKARNVGGFVDKYRRQLLAAP